LAIEQFKKSVSAQENDIKVEAFKYLAKIHQLMEEDELAIAACYEGLRLNPSENDLLLHASISCTNMLAFSKVLENFRTFLIAKFDDLTEFNFLPISDMYEGRRNAIQEVKTIIEQRCALITDAK